MLALVLLAGLAQQIPAPPLTLEKLLHAPAGATATWESLRGKVVVLEFWATWCAPCVEQLPHLNALVEKFAGRPVVFLSITDESEDELKPFLTKRTVAGWIGLDSGGKTFKAFGVEGRPTTILVDAAGMIRARTWPDRVTEAVIEEVLAGRTPNVPSPASAPPGMFTRSDSGEPPILQISIRPSQAKDGSRSSSRSGTWEASGLTLRNAIAIAYGVRDIQIEAPEWMSVERFDIAALVPSSRQNEMLPLARHALELAFGLRTRRETRERDALLLKVLEGSKPRLVETATRGSSSSTRDHTQKVTGADMRGLANNLEQALRIPVFDETDLEARYDFEWSWDGEDVDARRKALREQLGLDLVPARRPLETMIIEAADKPPAR